MVTPPMSSAPSVLSVVAAFAPARQIGYVGSRDSRPPGPKILRPRTDGAEYCTVTVLPPTAAVARAGGLWANAVAAHARATADTTPDLKVEPTLFRICHPDICCCRRRTRTGRSCPTRVWR